MYSKAQARLPPRMNTVVTMFELVTAFKLVTHAFPLYMYFVYTGTVTVTVCSSVKF